VIFCDAPPAKLSIGRRGGVCILYNEAAGGIGSYEDLNGHQPMAKNEVGEKLTGWLHGST